MPMGAERGDRRPPRVTRPRELRPSSSARGYGYRWQLYTKSFKVTHPLCRPCEQAGRVSATEAVDHIEPVTGPDDPLFWDTSNHQPICWSCHSSKTGKEGRRECRQQ